jgi:hypothetical protein
MKIELAVPASKAYLTISEGRRSWPVDKLANNGAQFKLGG